VCTSGVYIAHDCVPTHQPLCLSKRVNPFLSCLQLLIVLGSGVYKTLSVLKELCIYVYGVSLLSGSLLVYTYKKIFVNAPQEFLRMLKKVRGAEQKDSTWMV
jgi:hypothetical protein